MSECVFHVTVVSMRCLLQNNICPIHSLFWSGTTVLNETIALILPLFFSVNPLLFCFVFYTSTDLKERHVVVSVLDTGIR